MANSYLDILTQPAPKKSQREKLLDLAMQIFALANADEVNDAGFAEKDGTGPEIYVAPRVSPSP
jgi:hypothetical protein